MFHCPIFPGKKSEGPFVANEGEKTSPHVHIVKSSTAYPFSGTLLPYGGHMISGETHDVQS